MPPSRAWGGHLAAIFSIVVWGITFINIKVLLVSFSAIEIMFFRLVLAVGVLFAISPPRWNGLRLDRQALHGELRSMAAGLCGVTLYFLFQNLALTHTLAANVSVLISTAPLFTALVGRSVAGEGLKPGFLPGFAAAMAGIVLIAWNGSQVLQLNPLGDLLSLLAALAWAFYSVVVRKIKPGPGGVFGMTRRVFTYGLLFLLPALPFLGFQPGLERLADPANLLHLVFLGVGASALCYATWNYAVTVLGPVRTSIYIYLVPVVTIAAGYLALDEAVTPVAAAGVALILAGMAISERSRPG